MKKGILYGLSLTAIGMVLLAGNSLGQTTSQINTTYSNGSSNGATPFKGIYEDARNQPIYLDSELSAAGLQDGAVITSIAWYVSAVYSSQVYNNFEIKLGHTTIPEFTKTSFMVPSDHTTVFSGIANTKGTAGTWYTIDFSTPFVYIAGQNLVIETCFNNTSWTNSDNVAYSYDNGAYLQSYSYNDLTVGCTDDAEYSYYYRPVVKLTYTNPSNPTDYYISTSGSNSNDGSSGSPWATLTYAISQASSGDNINVAAGTYTADIDITLTKSLTIIGEGTEGSVKTTFDGGNSGTFMFIDANNVTLKKFVIQNFQENNNNGGHGDYWGGGAIEVDQQQTGILYEDMVFNANIASYAAASDGGAIWIQKGGSHTFKRCIFSGNRCGNLTSKSGSRGGAVYHYNDAVSGTLEFYSCLFYENICGGFGSAVAVQSNTNTTSNWITHKMYNCTFADNESKYTTSSGAAVYSKKNYSYLYNCAFADNISASTTNPYQAYGANGYEYLYNCRSTSSSIDYGYVNYSSWGSVTAAFTNAANNDYTLTSSSYFVNAGNNTYYPSDGDMSEGDRQSTADAGCFEYCSSATWDGSASSNLGAPANWNTNHPGCNDLTITNSGTSPAISGADGVTIPGDLTINNGATLTLSSNSGSSFLAVTGDFTNSGTFTHSGSAPLQFTGSAEQTINTGGSTLNNVEVDNTAGLKISGNKMTISGDLTLTNGGINTNGNILALLNEDPGAFTGWSNTNFITATSSSGALRLHIDNDGSSSAVYTAPLGLGAGSTNYARLDVVNDNLTNSSGSTFNYLDFYVEDDNESGNNHSQYLDARKNGTKGVYVSKRTYYMVPDNQPNSGTYDLRIYLENLTFGWGKGEVTTSAEDGKGFLVKADHTNTDGLSAYSAFDGTTTATSSYADGYIQQTGFTSFSKGKGVLANDPLPIDLLNFNAEVINEDLVDLTWTTASEINNDFFTIERSRDAVDFDILATVPGAGNSNEMLYYEAEDNDPMMGVSYYRLKQTDYDGNNSYSKIVSVKNLKQLNFTAMPNPTTDRLTVTFGKVEGNTIFVMTPEYKADIKIFNTEGKLVYKKKFDGTFYKFTIDVTKLPEGMYYINLKANNELYKTNFLKQ